MRRSFSVACLLLAWLCANGAVWNVVQVVAWAKMFHDYSQVMPAAEAIELTFDGTAPCGLCELAQAGQDSARRQLPRDSALGGETEKILLLADFAPACVLNAPAGTWPGLVPAAGLARTDAVPVPPPRA